MLALDPASYTAVLDAAQRGIEPVGAGPRLAHLAELVPAAHRPPWWRLLDFRGAGSASTRHAPALLAALQAAEPGRGWHVRGGAWAFPVATEPPVVFAPYLVAHEQGETGRAVCGPMLAYCGALAGAMMAAQDVDDLEVRMALVDVVARVDGSHPVLPPALPPGVDALGVHMENPDMLLTLVRRIGARVRECTGGLDMRDDALRALPAVYTKVLNIAGAPHQRAACTLEVLRAMQPARGWVLLGAGRRHWACIAPGTPSTVFNPGFCAETHARLRADVRRPLGAPLQTVARMCIARALIFNDDEYEARAEEIAAMPTAVSEPPAQGTPYEAHERMMGGGAYDVSRPLDKMPWASAPGEDYPSTGPLLPMCDMMYRCLTCPGGLGPRGRGYETAAEVPCAAPHQHMLAFRGYTRGKPLCPHLLSTPASIQSILGAPGTADGLDGDFCKYCAVDAGRNLPYAGRVPGGPGNRFAHSRVAYRGRGASGLMAHVEYGRREQGRSRGCRDGTPIQWCDGMYRCIVCDPVGRSRARRVRCGDPDAHTPLHGLGASAVCHFTSQVLDTASSTLPSEVCAAGRAGGCAACRLALQDDFAKMRKVLQVG